MYARLLHIRWKPTTDLETVTNIYRESILPAAREQKGFVAATLIHSEDDPEASLSISIWESKEDALTGEASGYLQEQVNKVTAYLAAPPERKGGNVGVHSSD